MHVADLSEKDRVKEKEAEMNAIRRVCLSSGKEMAAIGGEKNIDELLHVRFLFLLFCLFEICLPVCL
jgi:hypothetical protein